ncbi:NAD(P)/FAD-dependent oxidoreductase [Ornithinimicrobium cerasi]|uniref:NAD(P)/FAD-dependent oxidoreductase n=1 Tax=Ornithinimicrobium cerasi TaxID=2248773 RepID=UPI000EFFFC64|nr:FAD-binding oxidoreductase [Ornithinimicrobium cerasi]
MTDRVPAPRVAVVGGGVLGVATAAALAAEGADVTLVTDTRLGSGASGRSLSWLNSYGRRSGAYHELRMLGLDRYRTLAARTHAAGWLRFDGGLTWAPAGSPERHRVDFEHMRQNGYDAQWLTREEVADMTPGVDPAAIPDEGAIFNPSEGWVELPPLIDHLVQQLHARGGTVVEHAGPSTIVVEGDRVTAVTTASGDIHEVDAAVLATGPAVPATVASLGIAIPDATPISLLVRTPPVDVALRAVLNTPRVAVRPTPDGSLVLDSGWSEREIVVHEDGGFQVEDSTVQGLLREASAVLEGNPTLELASYGAGPKPIPGDGEPVVGQLPGIGGYHVLFTHSGATLALILGELLAREVLTDTPSPLLQSFRPARFAA